MKKSENKGLDYSPRADREAALHSDVRLEVC